MRRTERASVAHSDRRAAWVRRAGKTGRIDLASMRPALGGSSDS